MLVQPDALTEIPNAAMRPLADWFTATGRKLHDAADNVEEIGRWRQTAAIRIRTFKNAAQVLAAYLAEGRTPDEAARIVQKMTGLRDDQMVEVSRYARTTIARHNLKIRNRAIMRLVGRGWLNREIATRYKLHEKHVARLIAQQRAA